MGNLFSYYYGSIWVTVIQHYAAQEVKGDYGSYSQLMAS